jgi:hypothetical protein
LAADAEIWRRRVWELELRARGQSSTLVFTIIFVAAVNQ